MNKQKNKFKDAAVYLLPAILILLALFTSGIQTNLTTDGLKAHEADPPGIDMRLNDISSGFSRKDACRYYSIFPSIAISTAYVPYIWLRTGALPPYNVEDLASRHLPLISELIVLTRSINVLAALGIVILAFLIIFAMTGDLPASSFVSLSMALNPNLFFQSNVTYYENCAVFWVFLSLYFYVKLWLGAERPYLLISIFSACAAFAVSTHDRMSGYYILSFPALMARIWFLDRYRPGGKARAVCLFLLSGATGALVFCFANNIFGAGLKPVHDYLVYKYSAGAIIPDRMKSVWSLLRNQIGCHGHTLRLIFWNLGGITLLVSLLGIWDVIRKRYLPGLAVVLFLLGYQIVSVAVPGWTAGRYILGQTLFVSLFSAFGVISIMKNRPGRGKFIIAAALLAQVATITMVIIADTYYNPVRVAERVICGDGAGGKINSVGVRGFIKSDVFDQFPETWNKRPGVNIYYISNTDRSFKKYDAVISKDEIPDYRRYGLKADIVRKSPGWLFDLVRRRCNLYSAGPCDIYVYYSSK